MLNEKEYDCYVSDDYVSYIAKETGGVNIRFSRLWDTIEFSEDKEFKKVITIGTQYFNRILNERKDISLREN